MKNNIQPILMGMILLLAIGCNQQAPKSSGKENIPENTKADTAMSHAREGTDSLVKLQSDSALVHLSFDILNAFRSKNFDRISQFIHPSMGLRFSPYGHIDTARGKVFSKEQFLLAVRERRRINWGIFDGTGDPILLDIPAYFEKFVYDADFLHPEQRAVNKKISEGNTLDNSQNVYPASVFTEFYFSGFDSKYEGMDWKSLRLVFEEAGGKPFLVAVIHDQWTS